MSNLKYVKRITRQQAHVVARKEKERIRKNKNGVSGSRTVTESDSSDDSDGFDMTDSSDEECDEKFI